jgi:tetratricopeptide (TPR) repeat protein
MQNNQKSTFGLAILLCALITFGHEGSPASANPQTDQLVYAGYKLLSSGAYEHARQTLSQAVAAEPGNQSARRYLAITLLQLGFATQAAANLQEVINSGKAEAIDYYYYGQSQFYCADYSRAVSSYQYALKKDPKLSVVHTALSQAQHALRSAQDTANIADAPNPDS